MFERKEDKTEDTVFARKMVVHSMRVELEKQSRRGCMDLATSMVIIGTPTEYLDKMKKVGRVCGSYCSSDAGIHPPPWHHHRHPDSNLQYLRLPGGEIGPGESAGGQPIYVAYYEERKFSAGHYQAIEPLPDTNVTAFPELGRFILNLIHGFIHLYIFSTSRQSSIKNGFVPTRSKLDSCYELGSEEEEECQSRCQFRCKKKEYFIIIRDSHVEQPTKMRQKFFATKELITTVVGFAVLMT